MSDQSNREQSKAVIIVQLAFNMYLIGTMDHGDPVVTDGFANDQEVILFDNAGIPD